MATDSILLIEDETRLRNNLKILLSRTGYAVTTAADGREGMQYLQCAHFDLVITDLVMDECDGLELMEYLAGRAPETPVIVITGYASTESAIEALRKGAYDYIAKPFEVEMMQASVERALEKVRLQQELAAYMKELEQRVADRTRALEESNRQLRQSLNELKVAQEHLVQTEKLSALGALITGITHELNHPLGLILGSVELLNTSYAYIPQVRSGLKKIRQEALRCHEIVHNLLRFARKQKPEKTYLDVNILCLKTLDLLDYQFRDNNIGIVQHLAKNLPGVMADGHQLQQVLVNVLTNACQALSEEHPDKRQVTVTTAYHDNKAWIKIADTGPGIAAEHLRRIFDPFFTTKEQGTGLGLSLSYGIIKEHGGEFTVASRPGEGATFTIALPTVA
jgi:C4-dicarboxylate-specific signal transduction histidine kinase